MYKILIFHYLHGGHVYDRVCVLPCDGDDVHAYAHACARAYVLLCVRDRDDDDEFLFLCGYDDDGARSCDGVHDDGGAHFCDDVYDGDGVLHDVCVPHDAHV